MDIVFSHDYGTYQALVEDLWHLKEWTEPWGEEVEYTGWNEGFPCLESTPMEQGLAGLVRDLGIRRQEGNVSGISMPTWALERLLAPGLNLHPGT